jgi:hypothetical protein
MKTVHLTTTQTDRRLIFLALAIACTIFAALLLPGPDAAHAKGKIVTASKSFTSSKPDQVQQRYEVRCPKGSRPLGAGVTATPPVSANGNGVYPTSSERLGKQEGWHITVVQIGGGTYTVTLRVICDKDFKGDIDPVEKVLGFHLAAGETKTLTASCRGKKKVVSGGYLSTQFFSPGFGGGPNGKGVYVTESRRTSPKQWRIIATGVPGGSGGEVNPIAYCFKSKKPLLKEVSSSTPIGTSPATATTPPCPRKHPLVVGGFSAPKEIRIFDPNPDGNAWSVSGVNFLGAGSITAYGYCFLG